MYSLGLRVCYMGTHGRRLRQVLVAVKDIEHTQEGGGPAGGAQGQQGRGSAPVRLRRYALEHSLQNIWAGCGGSWT